MAKEVVEEARVADVAARLRLQVGLRWRRARAGCRGASPCPPRTATPPTGPPCRAASRGREWWWPRACSPPPLPSTSPSSCSSLRDAHGRTQAVLRLPARYSARLVTPQPTQVRCRAESRQVLAVIPLDAASVAVPEAAATRMGTVPYVASGRGGGTGWSAPVRAVAARPGAWAPAAGRSRRGGARRSRRCRRRRMCPR